MASAPIVNLSSPLPCPVVPGPLPFPFCPLSFSVPLLPLFRPPPSSLSSPSFLFFVPPSFPSRPFFADFIRVNSAPFLSSVPSLLLSVPSFLRVFYPRETSALPISFSATNLYRSEVTGTAI